MSKVTIQGDASGTGIFTIASPNSNTDRTLVLPDEAGTVLTTAGVPASAMPAGSVLQVIQTAITAGFSTTSGSAVDITGLTATITPSSSANKILVITNFFANGDSSPYPKFLLKRNGTTVFIGDAVGSSTRQSAGMTTGGSTNSEIISVATTYLDAPATIAAVTYQWQVSTFGSRAVYVGRSSYSGDANGSSIPSTITLMEVAA